MGIVNPTIHLNKWDHEYIKGGSWKCTDSPTGAHHWIGGQSPAAMFQCKWCNIKRQFAKSLEDQLPEGQRPKHLPGGQV